MKKTIKHLDIRRSCNLNQLLSSSEAVKGQLDNFADEFATILSRQLDKRGV